MVELFRNLSKDKTNTYGIVLSSSGIPYHMRKEGKGWSVWVNETDYEKALDTIERYLEENEDFPMVDETFSHEYQKTFTGLWASIILLACYMAAKTGDDFQIVIKAYGSSAFHILHGELYRSVTSLMLHANTLHLIGNIFGIAVFGTAVCTITGWGIGWFMIFVAGIIGNIANAIFFTRGHLSVGASTAIFGAIGILVAYQFFKKIRLPGQRIKAWVPLGGGLALLGFLGSGKHVDITAHLFGFMAGIIMGSLYTILVRRQIERSHQAYCFLITFSIIALSWLRAFGYI